ncbi:MAG: hypothetical protein MN733_39350 [Nitrososphaera sp.]|nr:hypothetical protein [Nitrososphaera sp.]
MLDKGFYEYIVIDGRLNAKPKNVLLIAIAAIAVVGWAFALAGGFPNQDFKSVDQQIESEERRIEMEQERLRTTVKYGYYNVGGNIPCISSEADGTPSIEIYAENIYAPDAVIDFTLTATRNAEVSLEESDGFQQSATMRLTVLEGTQTLRQAFHVKPHANVDDIQLTLDAKAIDPPDINLVYTLPFSNTVVFSNDGSGNYCRE